MYSKKTRSRAQRENKRLTIKFINSALGDVFRVRISSTAAQLRVFLLFFLFICVRVE